MIETGKPVAAPEPVRKSITVRVSPERAFEVFTSGVDSWWPRRHHIGSSPMRRVIFEERVGGRCYTEQEDGSEADFGTVLVWDPPRRFAMAWQVTTDWKFEPDLARSSEVEVVFTPVGTNETRVDLEHKHFERYGAAGSAMRDAVNTPDGWNGSLRSFAGRAEASDADAARKAQSGTSGHPR